MGPTLITITITIPRIQIQIQIINLVGDSVSNQHLSKIRSKSLYHHNHYHNSTMYLILIFTSISFEKIVQNSSKYNRHHQHNFWAFFILYNHQFASLLYLINTYT